MISWRMVPPLGVRFIPRGGGNNVDLEISEGRFVETVEWLGSHYQALLQAAQSSTGETSAATRIDAVKPKSGGWAHVAAPPPAAPTPQEQFSPFLLQSPVGIAPPPPPHGTTIPQAGARGIPGAPVLPQPPVAPPPQPLPVRDPTLPRP